MLSFRLLKIYKTIRNDMFHLYDLYNPDAQPDGDVEFNIGVYSEDELNDLREAQELYAREYGSLKEKDGDTEDEEE
jgi:hypothetical protein